MDFLTWLLLIVVFLQILGLGRLNRLVFLDIPLILFGLVLYMWHSREREGEVNGKMLSGG